MTSRLVVLIKNKFLLVQVLNKIHKYWGYLAVQISEVLTISSITLKPINGESKYCSVTRNGTFKSFLLDDSLKGRLRFPQNF